MYTFQTYLQVLEQRIRYLEDRLLTAEKELQTVKETIQREKPVHIDNITYKVQELTVSDLSGTLNVGLTALSDPKQLEQWMQADNGENDPKPVVLENLQSNQEGDA